MSRFLTRRLHPGRGRDQVTRGRANVKEPALREESRAPADAPPLAADMPARAPASRPAPARSALLAIVITAQIFTGAGSQCARDGLFADYERECREYVRCSGGTALGRYACPAGRAFSEAAGACVPRRQLRCVRRICAPQDSLAYASPGTACRHYYRCENGTAVEHACPAGSWFDLEMQACARGAGTCYEPVCAGLADGEYPDPSHECRRGMTCRAGELRAVGPCHAPACAAVCPPPRSAAAALPAGDADFCSDEACTSLCQSAADGAYADRSTGCREYFVCEARRAIRRGVCEPGRLFARGGCQPTERAECPPPARSPCFNRADGPHHDWRSCSAWFECRRERVVSRGVCGEGLAFDGAACLPAARFPCAGPEPAAECAGLPSGTYPDLSSNCTRYFHCEGALRTTLACATGEVFDGVRCAPAATYRCPSLERDSCFGRADGRYRGADGCRGYYACSRGQKAVYACAPGQAFDGEACVPRTPALCPDDSSCAGLADGYHPDVESGCHRYYYCERGDRLATLSCSGGKIFDGQACVEAAQYECGGKKRASDDGRCVKDGFFVVPNTECQKYYFCVSGVRTALACELGLVFNGQVCVPRGQYTCPG